MSMPKLDAPAAQGDDPNASTLQRSLDTP
jgi:hypothetical protein